MEGKGLNRRSFASLLLAADDAVSPASSSLRTSLPETKNPRFSRVLEKKLQERGLSRGREGERERGKERWKERRKEGERQKAFGLKKPEGGEKLRAEKGDYTCCGLEGALLTKLETRRHTLKRKETKRKEKRIVLRSRRCPQCYESAGG